MPEIVSDGPTVEPRYVTVGRLFNDPNVFVVQRYQRGYAWEDDEVDDFCNDLTKCVLARGEGKPREHFFGGVVVVRGRVSGAARNQCEIVDGQQRLATVVLLASKLVRAYKMHRENLGKRSKERKIYDKRIDRLSRQYLEYEDEVNRKIITLSKLELSNADSEFFRKLLDGQQSKTERSSHARLKRAGELIDQFLSDIISKFPHKKLDALESVEHVLNDDLTVIDIATTRHGAAYRLFQVLNDRGRSLTAGDLLRAKTLEMLEDRKTRKFQDDVAGVWDDILRDDPRKTEEYLRWYYCARQGERPGTSSLYDDFLDAMFPQHQNPSLRTNDGKALLATLQDIQRGFEMMRMLIHGQWPYDPKPPTTQWDRARLSLLMKDLGHTAAMPLLLAGTELSEKAFVELVSVIETFAFRYKYVCNQHIGPAYCVYWNHAKDIRVLGGKGYKVGKLRRALKDFLSERASESVFLQHLRELRYSSSGNKLLKYLLITLEDHWRWFVDGGTGRPRCIDKMRVFDFASTTIEHVYPQNAEPEDRVARLEEIKHGLGNLTILGPADNVGGGNDPYKKKRSLLARTKVDMNQELARNDDWGPAEIKGRRDRILEAAKKVFSL